MSSTFSKKAQDVIPYCEDQGIPYLVGSGQAGVSTQWARVSMPADGVVTFSGMGMVDMAGTTYGITIQNHTSNVRDATVADATRTTRGFTIAGPNAADLLDVTVVGRVAGQVG